MSKSTIFLLVFTSLFHQLTFAQNSDQYMQMADKAFDAGDKQKSLELYRKAAVLKKPDAHYAIAYKFIVTQEESIYHLSEAAKLGHSAALDKALEGLFFRSSSLTVTNPQLAYDIYLQAKKVNPNVELYAEEAEVATLNKCIEAGYFDFKKFINQYKITEKDTIDNYSIWELAEDASRGGRFGPPNPKLTLQLVCKGGWVPAEKIYAVRDAYDNWKENKNAKFNVCDYPSNAEGEAYCKQRSKKEDIKNYSERLKKLSGRLKNNAAPLLTPSFDIAKQFFDSKAGIEQHSVSLSKNQSREQLVLNQSFAYLDFIESINNGNSPTINFTTDPDKELNEVYKVVIAELLKSPIQVHGSEITDIDLKGCQRLWIKYRDSSAKLFAKLNPSISDADWRKYITKIRTGELKQLQALRKSKG